MQHSAPLPGAGRLHASDPGVVVHLERPCNHRANLMAAIVIQQEPCKLEMHATA